MVTILEDNNHSLIVELKGGSFKAFEKLYQQTSGKLYNFMMRLTQGNSYMSEEIVQHTFMRVWEYRDSIDPTKSFISYLCTIAKNISLSQYQKETVEFVYKEYITRFQEGQNSYTEEETDLHFLNDYIDKLIEQMPPSRKKIFVMSKRQQFSNKEIAAEMQISESTVATQLSLAVNFVKKHFEAHYDKLLFIYMLLLMK